LIMILFARLIQLQGLVGAGSRSFLKGRNG
jgi:hypothetical protein